MRILDMVRGIVAKAVVRTVTQGPVEQLQLEVAPGVVRGTVPRSAQYGFASATLPGAEAVVLSIKGSPDHLEVVAVEDRRYRPQDLAPGDVAIYNQHGDSMRLKASRELVASVDGSVVSVKAGEIKLQVGAASITITPTSIALKASSITLDP